jgi:hypothetical protein
MITVYLDWNAMSTLKRGAFPELLQLLTNKEKFVMYYSTSHISDIYSSYSEDKEQLKIINEDFDFITSLTNNVCIVNNVKEISISDYEPQELLEDNISNNELFSNISFDSIFKILEEDKMLSPMVGMLKSMLSNISMGNEFKEAFSNPESAKMMNTLFPNLPANPTMIDFFNSSGNLYNNLNEKEDYKELRNIVQKVGVNSGMYNNKNPFDVIDNAYSNYGLDLNSVYKKDSKNAPEWFNNITTEYLKLDMHGFKADEIKVKDKKKKTFKNTTEDSFHTAFASTCDFYITFDKKNYAKTTEIYKKLNINTIVFNKAEEFIEHYNKYLCFDNFTESLVKIFEIIKNEEFEKLKYKDSEEYLLSHISKYYFLNFFNKVMYEVLDEAGNYRIILSKDVVTNHINFLIKELRNLVNLLVNNFGLNDANNNSYFKDEEIKENENWIGRVWGFDIFTIHLITLYEKVQLYINVPYRDATT